MTQAVLSLTLALFLSVGAIAVATTDGTTDTDNPLLARWETPFGAPPFDSIRTEHFLPAFDLAMQGQTAEVAVVADSTAPATFANTIEALERSGGSLAQVRGVFFNLSAAHTNDELQAIAKEISPRLSAHRDDILLDATLFARVREVYEQRADLDLDGEQDMLLTKTYEDFVRGGANLSSVEKDRLRALNEELSVLAVQFSENLLKETNAVALLIDDEADLIGLSKSVRASAAATAAAEGHPGQWGFTLQRTSWTPFLQFSGRRDLRETLYTAYTNLGSNGNEFDNRKLASRIAARRVTRAKLLGYETHAAYVLEENMALEPKRVNDLLSKLWQPALGRARRERTDLQALIDSEGGDFQLKAWDWWYYSEKLRKARYDFDEGALQPYFAVDRVREAAFDVAGKLFGITFKLRDGLTVYQEDVQAWEVMEADGSFIGLYFTDYFTRPSKRGGAWMNNFREQRHDQGHDIRPIIVNVSNFTPPIGDEPALLTLDQTRTLFHEFGHALHGLLASGTYARISGTNVARDFVEFPSQMMENWAMAPEVLVTYARHYKTGEAIPQELIDKMQQADLFNQGFTTTEYLAASILDMEWHTLESAEELDALAFEKQVFDRIGLIPEIQSRYRTPYFSHISAGGYDAGYYGYVWAEVLDADAFEAFEEQGLFNQELAQSYRSNILSPGGSEPAMTLYKRFRGREPRIEPLLERRGLAATD